MILGIFASPAIAPEPLPFGTQGPLFAHIIKVAARFGITAFVFVPDDVPLHGKGEWSGWIPGGASWEHRPFSMPDVIYDRGLFTATPFMTDARRVRQFFLHAQIPLMQDPAFPVFTQDKWEFFRFCAAHKELRSFVPDTFLIDDDVDSVLFRDAFVIKPRYGQKGKGVVRFRKNGVQWRYDYRVKNTNDITIHKGILKNLHALPALIATLPFSYKNYIAQQMISGATFHRRSFDVRMIFQRVHVNGSWQRLFMGVRLAAQHALAANLSLGGSALLLSQLLKERFREDLHTSHGIAERLRSLGHVLCSTIAERFSVNEFAADVMIDADRKLWLLEINSKPDCGIFRHLGLLSFRDRFASNVCRYALSLCDVGD